MGGQGDSMIYFTSDLHFYHKNVIKHANRPYSDVDEMNERLISNWNKKVKEEDDIYILGDFTMKGTEYATDVLKRLNGKKYLIKGNHDKFATQETFDNSLFEWVKDYYELQYKNTIFILFHYPIEEWNHYFRGSIHLHGHQHNNSEYNIKNREKGLKRYDVGVDANKMSPVSADEILEFFDCLID